MRTPTSHNRIVLVMGDGGISFEIADEIGPTLTISHSFYGNIATKTKIFTNKASLLDISDFFKRMAEKDYLTDEYIHSAVVKNIPVGTKGEDFNSGGDGSNEQT